MVFDIKGFHDRWHIYPVGYRGQRSFAGEECAFEIRYEGSLKGPIFAVVVLGPGREGEREFSGGTPQLAWERTASELRAEGEVDGVALFGLGDEAVRAAIRAMPSAEKCAMLNADPSVEFDFVSPPIIAKKISKEEEKAMKEEAMRQRQEIARKKMEEHEREKVRHPPSPLLLLLPPPCLLPSSSSSSSPLPSSPFPPPQQATLPLQTGRGSLSLHGRRPLLAPFLPRHHTLAPLDELIGCCTVH